MVYVRRSRTSFHDRILILVQHIISLCCMKRMVNCIPSILSGKEGWFVVGGNSPNVLAF